MPDRSPALTYALITPAWNEERHLPALIQSVIAQTIRPLRWVIVSDGSTDRTDAIVQAASAEHGWIQLLRRERDANRHFAGKAQAVNAAYASLADLEFDLVGNLDADITLPHDFYEYLIRQFEADSRLGVAGAPFIEDAARPSEHSYNHRFAELSHVSGACQFFRRRCFDEVGGYSAVRQGGIDWIAVTSARMRGWTTRTFTDRQALHHRAMGTADRGVLRARFHHGQKDYLVGGHPLFQLMRVVFQMRRSPVVLGGLCLMAGYVTAWLARQPNTVPAELRAFHRAEQLGRLRRRMPFLRPRAQNRAGQAAETRS